MARLPAYAPDLNPVEGAWANMKNSLGNLGSCTTAHQLAAIIKNRLKRIQYRPPSSTDSSPRPGRVISAHPLLRDPWMLARV